MHVKPRQHKQSPDRTCRELEMISADAGGGVEAKKRMWMWKNAGGGDGSLEVLPPLQPALHLSPGLVFNGM